MADVPPTSVLATGEHDGYYWLEADHDLREFTSLCPEFLRDRFIAITSRDSGTFVPSEEHKALGWRAEGEIAYSPRLSSVADIPDEAWLHHCGIGTSFDEWLIFDKDPEPLGVLFRGNPFTTPLERGNVFPFVNMLARPTDSDLAPWFWKQLAWIQPESYISDGNDCLVFATSNKSLFEAVVQTLRSNPSSNT